jgi:hypothetical protein
LRYFGELKAITVDCHHATFSEVGASLGTMVLWDDITKVHREWCSLGNKEEQYHARDENTLCVQIHLLEKTGSAFISTVYKQFK